MLEISKFHNASLIFIVNNALLIYFQEIDVKGKKAIVIFVPVPQLKAYHKIQSRLVRELEKKYSGKHVIFIANVSSRSIYRML